MRIKLGLLAILAICALLLPVAALAQPPPPLLFQGEVTIGGEDAPVRTIISAEIEGMEVASNEDSGGTTRVGQYAIWIDQDGNTGKTVVFKVNGVVGGEHEYIDPWETPSVELDLSIPGPAATHTRTLTISSIAGGSVTTPGEGTFTRETGEVVGLVANPDDGYQFDEWTGDVSTVANVNDYATTVTIDGSYSITAHFSEISAAQYALTISSAAGGSVTTPGEGIFTYDAGEVVNLEASADAGYRFDEWTGDVSTVADVNASTTTITMDADKSVAAVFIEAAAPGIPFFPGGLSTRAMIGIVAAAVVVIALIVFLVVRRKRRYD